MYSELYPVSVFCLSLEIYFNKRNFNDHEAGMSEPAPAAIWGRFVNRTAHFDNIHFQADSMK